MGRSALRGRLGYLALLVGTGVLACSPEPFGPGFSVPAGQPITLDVEGEHFILPFTEGVREGDHFLILFSGALTTGRFRFQIGEVVRALSAQLVLNDLQRPDLEAERWLRAEERRLARRARAVAGPAVRPSIGEPRIGERRTFHVLTGFGGGQFGQVEAILRVIGNHSLLFVDVETPEDVLPEATLQGLADGFEATTYPLATDLFGAESDVNDDGRITALMTPAVNRLTPRGSQGFIGGFFSSRDLLPGEAFSNGQEMFYVIVPDPEGRFGDPRPVERIVASLPGIFAHEFQHMISFNQHVLVRQGDPEEVWLNEGLSHMAEDLIGERDDNLRRLALYLERPEQHALVNQTATLEQRGVAFLFLRYLADQFGEQILEALVQTARTGVPNVEAVTVRSFRELMALSFAAILLDDLPGVPERFQVRSLQLRGDQLPDGRRLSGPALHRLDLRQPSLTGTFTGSAAAFVEVPSSPGPGVEIAVSADSGSELRLLLVRPGP